MDRFLQSLFPFQGCKGAVFHLAFAWLAGLIAGSVLSGSPVTAHGSQFSADLITGRGIAMQALILLLPLICSAMAVYVRQPKLLTVIAFIKAFLFAYVAAGILRSSGNAGWLIQLLLMFGDTLMLPLLWWYWLCAPGNHWILRYTAAAAIPALAVIFLDSCIILPVLANLT